MKSLLHRSWSLKGLILVINLESIKCYIATHGIPTLGCNTSSGGVLPVAVVGTVLTLVTTARMAMPCMMGCHAPMSCAFCGTMRLNWVVSFHASNRISNMLFIRARRGPRGNDATNRVTKPNCITVKGRGYTHRWGFHLLETCTSTRVLYILQLWERETGTSSWVPSESSVWEDRSMTVLKKPARWRG